MLFRSETNGSSTGRTLDYGNHCLPFALSGPRVLVQKFFSLRRVGTMPSPGGCRSVATTMSDRFRSITAITLHTLSLSLNLSVCFPLTPAPRLNFLGFHARCRHIDVTSFRPLRLLGVLLHLYSLLDFVRLGFRAFSSTDKHCSIFLIDRKSVV